MKRNISSILNGISEIDVPIREKTPLCAGKIRYRTMKKIGQEKQIRWLPRVAVIAAAIMVMTVSVFAADVAWNDGALFSVFFGRTPSSDEMSLMEDIGRSMGETITQNGATVTAVEGVADQNTYWLHLRVEAPEGVVLPDMPEDESYFYYLTGHYLNDVKIQRMWSLEQQWHTLITTHTIKPLEDSDPTDNCKDFCIIFYALDGSSFTKGGQLRLVMPGLYIHKGKSPEIQTLFAGKFVFDISVEPEKAEQRKLVIDTGGVSFYNEEYGYTTTVSKVTLSPLHVDISFTNTEPGCEYIFPYGGPLDIVMKDGTVIRGAEAFFDAREQNVADPDDVAGSALTCLEYPLVVENIDYIILGGEYVFDVN